MNRRVRKIIVGSLCVILFSVVSATGQPPTVPRITERSMDRASYVQLAKEWKEYIEKRGETAFALVNLGTAYEYSGQKETAMIAGRRAVEIEPDNPEALAFLGSMLSVYKEDMEGAKTLLARCIEIAPDHKRGLLILGAVYMKGGEFEESDKIFRSIFDQRIFAGPIEDFAYNLLIGLPQGAVLVTNGDTDTFPCLALQAGMKFRPDIVVVNRHLLRLVPYAEAVFTHHASIRPAGGFPMEGGKVQPAELLERLIDENKAPVYFACTVPLHDLGFEPDVQLECLSYRSSNKGLTAEESARLVLEKCRLDSATDWGFAWDIAPTVSKMMWNYAACMVNLAKEKGVSGDTRRRLLEKASEIAEFHDMDATMLRYIESLREKK